MSESAWTAPRVKYPVYTMGDMASGCFAVLPAFLLMFYMTNIMGISVALATTVVLVPKLVDLVAAPLVGNLSDRTRSRLGRRRPWMLAASLLILATFPFIWIAPFRTPEHSAYFILAMFSVCTVAVTCFAVPFLALNSELARDYSDRTTLNAYRTLYSCIGMMTAGAIAPLIVALGGGGRHGYSLMGIVIGVMMASVTMITFWSAREPVRPPIDRPPTASQSLAAISSNPSFMMLATAYFIYIAGSGLSGAVLVYFTTYILARGPELLSLIFFVSTGSSIVAIPVWTWFGERAGKLGALMGCFVPALAAPMIFSVVTHDSPLWLVIAAAAVSGLSAGGIQIFFFSMLADSIRHGGRRTIAIDCSALLTGFFVASEKLGFAAGALFAGLLFDISGLLTTTEGRVTQPDSAIAGIRLGVTWLPAMLSLGALIVLILYRRFDRELRDASLADGMLPLAPGV